MVIVIRVLNNYIDFIDLFKSLQNIALKESDINQVRLKFDEICNQTYHSAFDFNFEEVQNTIDSNQEQLEKIKDEVQELGHRFKDIDMDTHLIDEYLSNVPQLQLDEQKDQSFARVTELDDLLFSTQRRSINEQPLAESIGFSITNLSKKYDSNQKEKSPETLRLTIERLTEQLYQYQEGTDTQVEISQLKDENNVLKQKLDEVNSDKLHLEKLLKQCQNDLNNSNHKNKRLEEK